MAPTSRQAAPVRNALPTFASEPLARPAARSARLALPGLRVALLAGLMTVGLVPGASKAMATPGAAAGGAAGLSSAELPATGPASRPFQDLADAACGLACVLPSGVLPNVVLPAGRQAESAAGTSAGLLVTLQSGDVPAQASGGVLAAPGQSSGGAALPLGMMGPKAALTTLVLGLVLSIVGAWHMTGRPVWRPGARRGKLR